MRTQPRLLPGLLQLPAVLAGVFLLLPLVGLCARAPWSRFGTYLAGAEVKDALVLSLECSLCAALAAMFVGLPLAAWLADGSSRLRAFVRVLVLLPMVLPPVVGGVALLLAFGRNGLVGAPLEQLLGVTLPFSKTGVILAETYVALPFFVLTLEGGLATMDRRYAAAAATLGAGPWRVFATVTLPMVAPILRSGFLLAWARALGEFGATITFAGNLAGETRTMPLAIYVALETTPEVAIVFSMVLVLASAAVLFAMRRQWMPLR